MQCFETRLRTVPTGHKGQDTVARILEAAGHLMEVRGYEALTTNHIAEVAGINIATLYKYFENKQTILIESHARQSQRWTLALTRLVTQIRDGAAWRDTVHHIIDIAAERRREAPGSAAIRIAMRLSPELQSFDRAESIASARIVSELLITRASLDPVRALRIARVSIEVGMAVLDLWLQEGQAHEAAWIGEAKAVVTHYLAPYFEAPEQD
jgi:AcrR family transcriptional regulator